MIEKRKQKFSLKKRNCNSRKTSQNQAGIPNGAPGYADWPTPASHPHVLGFNSHLQLQI